MQGKIQLNLEPTLEIDSQAFGFQPAGYALGDRLRGTSVIPTNLALFYSDTHEDTREVICGRKRF